MARADGQGRSLPSGAQNLSAEPGVFLWGTKSERPALISTFLNSYLPKNPSL